MAKGFSPVVTKDKNKSQFKLQGVPRIYYISLDDHAHRQDYMESQFEDWGITNFERISAHDGRGDNDLSDILKGSYPKMMSSGEVGCVTSHLKALKHWLDTTEDEEFLLMMEDDCDISTAAHWGFSWREFVGNVPSHVDCVQLAVINPSELHIKLHIRFVNDFSTASYLIRRSHAEKLVRLYCRGDKYKLDSDIKPRAVADDLIYNSGVTLAMPLFAFKIALGSSIHDVHINTFHKSSHDGIWEFWKKTAPTIENWKPFFNYDAYLGTLPPNVVVQQWQQKQESKAKDSGASQ
ncbi:glycosyltransferase family 25 [Synechococcus phage ACG-2014f]|uniref:Glycosyltransferase family 25 n=1 Tax=Synechococcus phage ACG-2014f TaxID=1493511 RepID=A0A0E3HIS5_9CAUD|nr:glycosyltransferase family 25 [Synechococcus phage ACG-2014f]